MSFGFLKAIAIGATGSDLEPKCVGGDFQTFGCIELVAPIVTAFKKPKDIYKTCVWVDFHTFHCLNGRETIWEAL